ncbi:MAG: hypothetical protein WBA11_11255, partial [Rubrivirga sp.]
MTSASRSRSSTTRALASLAASLAVVNAAFLLWPNVDLEAGIVRQTAEQEMVAIELVDPTAQPPPGAEPPAPPPPPVEVALPPVEVPDEVIVDEIVQDIEIEAPPLPDAPAAPRPGPVAPPAPP